MSNCQATQVERKEAEKKKDGNDQENKKEEAEEADQETRKEEQEEEERKCDPAEGGSEEEKKEKMTEDETQVPKATRRLKTRHIKVTLLDNTLFECELDVRAFFTLILLSIVLSQQVQDA